MAEIIPYEPEPGNAGVGIVHTALLFAFVGFPRNLYIYSSPAPALRCAGKILRTYDFYLLLLPHHRRVGLLGRRRCTSRPENDVGYRHLRHVGYHSHHRPEHVWRHRHYARGATSGKCPD